MSILTTAGYRTVQLLIKAHKRFSPQKQQLTETGIGSIYKLPQTLAQGRLKKPMIVLSLDDHSRQHRLERIMEDAGMSCAFWTHFSKNPTSADGENLRLAYVGSGCDCLVVLGGPAEIDLVKLVSARVVYKKGSIDEMVIREQIAGYGMPPVFVIPSVVGSGAESLMAARFTDAAGKQYAAIHSALMPKVVFYDPQLFEHCPRNELAAACAEGITLALEAYLSGCGSAESDAMAIQSMQLYLSVVENCWNGGGTKDERLVLAAASQNAGLAASNAGFGYTHAIALALASSGISYTDACAVLLPAVIEKYGVPAAERLVQMANEIIGDAAQGSAVNRTNQLLTRIRILFFRMDLPDSLSLPVGFDVNAAAKSAEHFANTTCVCPVLFNAQTLAEIINSVN